MDRRKFIIKSAQLGTAVFLGSSFIGCKKSDPCSDLSALTPEEIKERESYKYVAKSPSPMKTCKNCELYTAPEHGSSCGSCGLFEGPVHSGGYCDGWVLLDA